MDFHSKDKNKATILLILSVCLILEVIFLIIFGMRLSKNLKFQNHLSLGNKYFNEMDYENAEFQYLTAIQINKKEVVPYINLSHVYIATEQYDEAMDILESAKKSVAKKDLPIIETRKNEIKSKLSSSSFDNNDDEFVNNENNSQQSSSFQTSYTEQYYNGNIYTVYDVDENSGFIRAPGWYMSNMIINNNYIYTHNPDGTSGEPTTLDRYSISGNEIVYDKKIIENIIPYEKFYIYNNILYCTVENSNQHLSKSINLETLQSKNESYSILYGSDDIWVCKPSEPDGYYQSDILYYSYPEFKEITTLPAYINKNTIIGVHGEYVYYLQGYTIARSSRENINQVETISSIDIVSSAEEPLLLDDGIYYLKNDTDKLYRYDLLSEEVSTYELSMLEECLWPYDFYNEINDKLYFGSHFYSENTHENTNGWELDLLTGNIRKIGMWFES